MRERDSFKGRRGKIWGEGKGSEWEKGKVWVRGKDSEGEGIFLNFQ